MNGYTFSTSFDPPDKPWGKIALAILAMILIMSVAMELGLRQIGYRPSIQDKPSLWATHRSKAQGLTSKDVVLIGSSRFHLGIDPQTLSKALPNTPEVHQLAISAGAILPIFEDLSKDTSFKGTVILEYHPVRLGAKKPAAERTAKDYLHSWQHGSAYDPVESTLRAWLQHRLVVLHNQLNFKNLGRTLVKKRKLPDPPVRLQQPDRRILYNANVKDLSHLDKKWAEEVGQQTKYSQEELNARIERMAKAAKRIRDRGGKVIVFRINASGHFLKAEKQHMPRQDYYERARKAVGGKWIHFEDDPILKQITCPDGSHVMGDDVIKLTKALAKHIQSATQTEER